MTSKQIKDMFAADFVKAANKALAKLEKIPLNKKTASASYNMSGTIGSMLEFLPKAATKKTHKRVAALDDKLEKIL